MPILAEQYGRFRVEDLDRPEVPEKGVEIIEGDLMVMAPAGKYHNRISHRLETLFEVFCKGKPELDFGGYNDGFLVERDPDSLLSPDASLYRYQPEKEKTWLEFSPDIAVEVLSPSNNVREISFKRNLYLQAGSEQVWVADPESESIEFFFREGRRLIASDGETVIGEGIAQGLQINLNEIFKKRLP